MLEIFPIYITPFKQERLIRVYLPKNYNMENKRYPVLYMHDGQNVFRDKDAIGGKSLKLEDYLDKTEMKVIVVGIDQNSEERKNEYCPWVSGEYSKKILGYTSSEGGKGTEYIDFIVNELKPHIDNKYLTLPDQSAMAGISLGGLISTFAACRYPYVFTRVAAISSAFYRNQEELEKLIIRSDLSSIEVFYLDCGTKEASSEELISKEFIASNNSIYEILREKIPNTKFDMIHDAEHNYSFFKERVPEIISFLVSAK